MRQDYEMVIGLEVHAQLTTNSKLFSGSSAEFGAEPNTQTCPVDLGMPGVLPVLNTRAVDMGIKFGLAIDANINRVNRFDRKNYFYPDLPKGYQISQMDYPIVEGGYVDIELEDGSEKRINVTRMHLEEDAGKSIHDLGEDRHSHVDLNRAGVPLMEIVSEPELRTAEEAGEYLKKLRSILRFLEVCDGNMEQGSMRCDANVSVRKKGEDKLNTRVEIKNLNSIRNVMRAIEHEAERQIAIYEYGGEIDQETRLWDATKNETRTMRSKEDAHDYRYFPCPDLLPVRIPEDRIEELKKEMPELPDQKKERFMKEYGLSKYDASVLSMQRASANFYESLVNGNRDAKICANWMMGDFFAALNKAGKDISESPISPEQLGELMDLISEGTISGKIAKTVFEEMFETSRSAKAIVEEKGLVQINDTGAIEAIIEDLMQQSPENVQAFREGKTKVMGWFVGQTMKATQGKANPAMVNQILQQKLQG